MFASEELPIRLAHRVKELEELPGALSEMPSIVRVKNWYAQSFKVSYRRRKRAFYQIFIYHINLVVKGTR